MLNLAASTRRSLSRPAPLLRLSVLVATAAFLIDWASKSWALDTVHDVTIPIGNLVLGVARNDAFAFSSGEGRFSPVCIAGARLLVLIALLSAFRNVIRNNTRGAIGLALLTAGGFGNVADVMFRDGAVVDFIGAGPFAFSWRDSEPVHIMFVFNIADIAILTGLVLLAPMIHAWAVTAQHRLAMRAAAGLRQRATANQNADAHVTVPAPAISHRQQNRRGKTCKQCG